MRTTIAELVAVLAMDSTRFQQGMTKVQTQSMRMGQNLTAIGKRMSMMVTLPIVAVGVATTKMAMDFESQMANIFTLMDKATIASRDWKKEVLDLSKKVPQSTDVLSKGLYDIVSAGIDAGKAMDVLEVASKAATAGLTNTAVSADAITSVLNAYGLEAEQASDVSDILFTTIRYGKTTFDELGPAIGRVVSTASAAGVSFDEVGAALATMTISGLKTDEAVTALNQTILSFLKPTDQAIEAATEIGFELNATTLSIKGLGGAMTELSEKLGITVDDMVAMEQAGLSDAEMYDELALRTGKSAEMLAQLFPNIRALKGALTLAKDEGAKFNEMLDKQEDRLGATTKAFDKIAETTKFQFDLALSSLKAVAIEMGTHLLPIATKLFKKIGELADAFGNLSDEAQQATWKIGGTAAGIGVLLYGIGKFMTIAPKLLAILSSTVSVYGMLIAGTLLLGKGVEDIADKFDNRFIRALIRMMHPTSQVVHGFREMRAVIKGLREETITWGDLLRMSGYELEDWVRNQQAGGEASDELAEKQEKLNELFERGISYISNYSESFPQLTDEIASLIESYNAGGISQEGFILGMTELIAKTKEAIAIEEGLAGERGINLGILTRLMGITIDNTKAIEKSSTQTELATESTYGYAKSLREATEDIEDFTSALSKAYSQLFAIYLLNADLDIALDAAQKAFEDYTDAISTHGAESDEAIEKERNWINILNTAAVERIPSLITKIELLTDEEVIYLNGMQDLIDKAVEMGIGSAEVWDNMSADISSKIHDKIIKSFSEMAAKSREVTASQEEDLKSLGENVDSVTEDIAELKAEIDSLESKHITITRTFKTIGEMFSGGGLVDYKQGGLIQAQSGLNLGGGNARPVIIHPPELILNKEQALNILWGMANKPIESTPQAKNVFPESFIIHNVIEMDRQVLADQISEIKIDEEASRI